METENSWLDFLGKAADRVIDRALPAPAPAPAGGGVAPGGQAGAGTVGGMPVKTILIYLGLGIAAILLVRAFSK